MRTLVALLFLAFAPEAFGAAVIFSGSDVKALRQNLSLNGVAKILTGTNDPSSVATDAPQGSIYLRTGGSGGTAYLKQDNGITTNWTIISTGGGGGGGAVNNVTKTANATLLNNENFVVCDTVSAGAAITLTLPDCDADKRFTIKQIGGYTCTIAQDGDDQFDQTESTIVLSPGGNPAVNVSCEGSYYYVH